MTWHLSLDYDRAVQVPGSVRITFGEGSTREVRHNAPDDASAHEIICKRCERAGYRVVLWAFEQSTNGWHAKVKLDPEPRTPMEVVALQAVCGSDPMRESCNIQRAREVERMDVRLLVARLRECIGAHGWLDPTERADAERLDTMLKDMVESWGPPHLGRELRW